METNGRPMEAEIHIEQDASNPIAEDEEELQVICDGTYPYKKVKLNTEGKSKKKNPEVVTISDDEDDVVDHSRKGVLASESGKDKEEKKKKKKNKKKKERDEGDGDEEGGETKKKKKKTEEDGTKKKKKKKEGAEGEKEGKEGKEKKKKKKDKNKDGDDKDKEKEKKKKKKKKEKGAEGDQTEKDKEKKKKKKKEKALEAYQKKFAEFEKKYPKYIQKGKIKFPIDDMLFILYDTILAEHVPKIKKPVPKNGLIPPAELGDILQIWNFYISFPELFSFKNIPQEEIYACLKYDGDEHLSLIDNLHQEVLFLFVKDFLKKNKFETFRDEVENPFFVLIKYYCGYEDPQSSELSLIWTEFLKRLIRFPQYSEYLGETTKRFIEVVSEHTTLKYNKVEYKMKIRALLELINLSYESEAFKDCLQEKMDQVTGVMKERSELLQEIKQEEQEYYDLKAKIELAEKVQKEEEEKWEQLPRAEVVRRQKETENERKELQKTIIALSKVEASLDKKRKRIEEINSTLNVNIETGIRLGLDGNKSEYWVFQGQSDKLYVKMSPIVYTEDTWRYYDEKSELDTLQEALNTKGIKEKSLSEKIKEAITNGLLDLKDIKVEPVDDSTTTTSGNVADKKKDENDINFWFAKALEFTPSSETSEAGETARTTRHKAQEKTQEKPQKTRPRDLKYITLDGIKELLEKTEEGLTSYLEKWNARWANPKVKEDLKRRIKDATQVKELGKLLLELDKNFQYSETPIKPKVQEGEENVEEEVHEEEDDDEDEEEEEEERQYEEEKEDRRSEEHFYGEEDEDDIKIKKKSRKRADSEVERSDRPEMEEEEKSYREERMEEEEDKESKMEVRSEVPENKDEGEKPTEAGAEGEPPEKVKKTAIKIWTRANERIRRCWLAFTKDADNVVGLFLCVSIWCELVETYVAKKMEKYFANYKNVAEYMAAKRENKKNAPAKGVEKRQHQQQSQQQLESLKNQREMRRQNYTLTRYAAQSAKFLGEDLRDKKRGGRDISRESSDAGHRGRNGGDSGPKRIRKLRVEEQLSDRSESEDDYPIKLKADAASRAKKDKLNELMGVRRSTRVTRKPDLVEDYSPAEEEEEEQKDCAVCRRGGDLATCNMCDAAYHLDCAGLKSMPDKNWTCFSCLQKLASQRQTRSTTRKLL